MQKLGLLDPGVKPHEMVNPLGVMEWEDMTPEQRQLSSRAMETYAAMVQQLDENIGRVIDQLEKDGELDNTYVMFMSDNGAEGASYEAYPVFGPALVQTINNHYNNELDNIGEPDSEGPVYATRMRLKTRFRLVRQPLGSGGDGSELALQDVDVSRGDPSSIPRSVPSYDSNGGLDHPSVRDGDGPHADFPGHGRRDAPMRGREASSVPRQDRAADAGPELGRAAGWEDREGP